MPAIVLASLLVGCASGYAAQEADAGNDTSSKTESDPETPADDEAAPEPQPTCTVDQFDVHYFDESTQMTKTIDCAERKVLDVRRSPINTRQLQSAEEAGLPPETWYVLVDPKSLREAFLTNDQLIQLSREYDLQFLGRDEHRNLLIYEYRSEL